MTTALIEAGMGRKKVAAKTSPVRLTDEAHEAARIASGFTGESLTEYVSRLVVEKANQDIDRYVAEREAAKRSQPPPKR